MCDYYTEKSEETMKTKYELGVCSIADGIYYRIPVAEMSQFEDMHKAYLIIPNDNIYKEQARNKINTIIGLLSTSLDARIDLFKINSSNIFLKTLNIGDNKVDHFRIYGDDREMLNLLIKTKKCFYKIYKISENEKVKRKTTNNNLNKFYEETNKILEEVELLNNNL